MNPKYPEIVVPLIGEDGNIFAIIGRITRYLRRGGVPKTDIEKFQSEIYDAGSYEHALTICMEWVNIS